MIDGAFPVESLPVSTPQYRPRLAWIDGLRGLAALYVVLFHVWKLCTGDGSLPEPLRVLSGWMAFGFYAVPVFIVLSGFCLMQPVLMDGGRLRGGARGYLRRRARRILPPYQAALISSIVLVFLGRLMRYPAGLAGGGPGTMGDLEPGSILSHLLLVHNLREGWTFTINSPLWSIAVEWQIYFLFPALLLPVWRTAGLMTTVAMAFLLGILPHLLLSAGSNFDWTTPWYLGLFALGMAAAVTAPASTGMGRVDRASLARAIVPTASLIVCGICTTTLIAIVLFRPAWTDVSATWRLYTDLIVGGAASSLLVSCHHRRVGRCLRRPLEARPVAWLGIFSYSLYLVHAPLLASAHTLLRATGFPPATRFVTMLALVLPICLLVAYCFHRVLERPFMNIRAGESNRLE